jgi:hypothetical protein
MRERLPAGSSKMNDAGEGGEWFRDHAGRFFFHPTMPCWASNHITSMGIFMKSMWMLPSKIPSLSKWKMRGLVKDAGETPINPMKRSPRVRAWEG